MSPKLWANEKAEEMDSPNSSSETQRPGAFLVTGERPIRVLYSFPHKLGADRICYTAWHQVKGLAGSGADVLVYPGVLHRPVPDSVKVQPTLAWRKLRLPYKVLGTMRTLALHDRLVAHRLERLKGEIDIVHVWPDAALETLKVASRLGIPTVLERPNAHTQYAYESVQRESSRLGIILPPSNEYAFKPDVLRREEEEYRLADYLLCPSDFVAKTFAERGFPEEKLLRHQYGFDAGVFHAGSDVRDGERPFTMFFAGDCAVRKGLHFALEAWLRSSACADGRFMIAGTFLPEYAAKLRPKLGHPSVQVLGYRNDVPELMRNSDVFVLPSIEEGSALVTSEARGSGCVLLVSDAAGAICRHGENALVHPVGDVTTLAEQITALHQDRSLLRKLRAASLASVNEITWESAGRRLVRLYSEVVAAKSGTRIGSEGRQSRLP